VSSRVAVAAQTDHADLELVCCIDTDVARIVDVVVGEADSRVPRLSSRAMRAHRPGLG